MRKLFRSIPVLLFVLGIMVAGIGGAGAQDQLTFSMVSHGGIGNPFWVVVIKGMEDACALLSADCAWLADPVDSIDDMAGYWDDALARATTMVLAPPFPIPKSFATALSAQRKPVYL